VKSSSPERLVDEALLVLGGQRLAGDLLGGGDGQVGHLAADLADRAAGLGLDVLARLLHELLALGRAASADSRSAEAPGRAGAGDDLLGLRAGLLEALAVLREQLVGLGLRAAAVSMESSIARWRLSSASVIFGNAYLRRMNSATKKDEQRPQHEPDVGAHEERRALLLLAAAALDEAEDEAVALVTTRSSTRKNAMRPKMNA
jgi:hypothetical protein